MFCKKYGVCPEAAMPYSTLTSLESPKVPGISGIAEAQAGQYKISAYAQIASTTDTDRSGLLDTIRQALARGRGLLLWPLLVYQLHPGRKRAAALPGGTVLGGHAVGIVGDLPDIGCLILRNTWGREWGY